MNTKIYFAVSQRQEKKC